MPACCSLFYRIPQLGACLLFSFYRTPQLGACLLFSFYRTPQLGACLLFSIYQRTTGTVQYVHACYSPSKYCCTTSMRTLVISIYHSGTGILMLDVFHLPYVTGMCILAVSHLPLITGKQLLAHLHLARTISMHMFIILCLPGATRMRIRVQ